MDAVQGRRAQRRLAATACSTPRGGARTTEGRWPRVPSPSLGRPFPVHCSVSCVVFSPNGQGCSSMVLAEGKLH
eukprot:2952009-Pyramimonas_sp.AAC.1